MIALPLGTRFYKDKSIPVSIQNLVNMYTLIKASDAKTRTALHLKPGKGLFGTAGNGPIRGMKKMNGVLYVVSGTALYSVNSSGVGTSLGTITGLGRVWMDVNLVDQLTITNGTSSGYVYTVAGGLVSTTLTGPAYTNVHSDGYQLFDYSGTNNWFISSNTDSTVFDSTETGATNDKGDKVLLVAKSQNRVIVFCEDSVEGFYVTPTLDFPYQKDRGVSFSKGAISRNSISELDEVVYWLGSDKEVYQMTGLVTSRISDESMAYEIGKMTTISDAEGVSFNFEGQNFYQLTFPAENKTFVFHANNRFWYQWGQLSNGTIIREKTNTYEFIYNKHLMGDYQTGKIYYLDSDTFTDNSDPIRWETTLPPFHNNHEPFTVGKVVIDCQTGVGLSTGQGSDPQIFYSISEDAQTLGDNERQASVGKIGKYNHQVQFFRNGRYRDSVYIRLAGSDPVRWVISNIWIDL